ncbi:DUF4142 domain-containing protein [Actinoplanes sp. NPDC049802]|uniref:DUF4142 domain-containing protein n=1 Tax=Actinoplanes sp. NPDC049802 TaxID=3154742 RepID=UPI0033C2D8EF
MLLRRIAAAIGAAALVGLPATAAQAEPSEQDTAFLRAAHQIHNAEVEQGRIAWVKTGDAEVKKLAATLMRDHIHLNAALAEAARKLKVRLPDTATAEQTALAGRYAAAGKGAIDDLFIDTQLTVSRETGRLVATQLAEGSDPLVRSVAEKAAAVLAEHQRLLRAAAA